MRKKKSVREIILDVFSKPVIIERIKIKKEEYEEKIWKSRRHQHVHNFLTVILFEDSLFGRDIILFHKVPVFFKMLLINARYRFRNPSVS